MQTSLLVYRQYCVAMFVCARTEIFLTGYEMDMAMHRIQMEKEIMPKIQQTI